MSYCQGTLVMDDAPPINQDLADQVCFPIIHLPGDCRPKLNLKKPVTDPNVSPALEAILESVTQKERDDIEKFHHSALENDPVLSSAGSIKLGTKSPMKTNRRLAFMQFVRRAIDAPEEQGKILRHTLDLSADMQLEVDGNSASAGFVPTKRSKIQIGLGTKRHNKWASVAVNEHDRHMNVLPAIPHQQFKKSEVIKKGKDTRTIQIQGQSNYIIDKLSTGPPNRPATGIAVGLKSTQGGYQKLAVNWYLQYIKDRPGASWNDFLDFLEKQGFAELDKKGWEASTQEQDGLPYIMDEISKVEGYTNNTDKKLHARALADYCNPLISLGTWGFFASWRVASGTYRTSQGNSERHRMMVIMVCDLIEMAKRGCQSCFYCNNLKVEYDFDPLILKMRRVAAILGDDFLAPAFSNDEEEYFGETMDRLCGTTTTGGVEPAFGEDGAEFLRRRMVRTEEGSIITQRETVRVLAKIVHGQAKTNAMIFNQALLSARYEAGANKRLQDILLAAHKAVILPEGDTPTENMLFQSYQKSTPQVADMPVCTGFSGNDVCNMEKLFTKNYVEQFIDNQFYSEYRTGLEWEKTDE